VNKFSADQRAWFEKFTASLGIPFVDLTPHFQKAATQGELTHFPGNVHLTPAGHRIVAENIRSAVTQV
jgi:hypothetical protein